MKPEFVDNRDGNTLVAALRGHLGWLADTYARPIELAIASGYFNPEGFGLLADHLERLPKVRLLLGAEPTPPSSRPARKIGESLARFDSRVVHEAIRANDAGLLRDRNLLEFAPATEAAIRRLLALLESGTVEVRRYEKGFLHGKAFIFADDEGVIAGSSNFTAAGLTSNLELNLGRYDPTPVRQVKQWFDDLWAEAQPFDLSAIYKQRYEEYPPYLVYLRVLWELYGRELEEEQGLEPFIHLTTFQSDGLWRARRILGEFNGVLFADGVGLGKTFVAGELIREAVQDRRQRVLLIAPAALRDGMWSRFTDEHQIHVEAYSFEQLLNDRQLGGGESYLKYQPNEYAMVVVDEAHVFRNPDTRRAQALRRLLLGKPPKQLVLLTATPVNNSLWDLYYLLTLFVGHDAVFAERGIRSLKDRFSETARENPDDLRPDMLFDVLDAVTVRRTRHFVRRYYPNDRIRVHGGEEIPVQFPEPHVDALTYDLEDALPGFFEQLKQALAPEDEEQPPLLTMTRYCPSIHRLDSAVEESQLTLVGLIRSGLLKRFESSAYAFAQTARRMAERLRGIPFREVGSPSKKALEGFEVFFSAARAASFAMSIRLGRPQRQMILPGFAGPAEVLDDFLTCMADFNAERTDALHQRIQNETYFTNFTALARKLAPDGEKVKTVGFTSVRGDETKQVALSHPPGIAWRPKTDEGRTVKLIGTVRSADETSKRKEHPVFGVEDDNGKKHNISVPPGHPSGHREALLG